MSKADKTAYALWLLAVPLTHFGAVGATICALIGLGFFVAARLDKDDSEPILSLGSITPQPSQEVAPKSNLTCVVTSIRTTLTPNTVRETETGDLSFVAAIQNKPTESGVRTVEGVRAYLEFKKSEKEVYSGNGAWVNVPQDSTTLKSGGQARLVLAIIEESTETILAVTNSRSTPLPRVTYGNLERTMAAREQQTIKRYSLVDDFLTIKATLTDSRGKWCGTFDFRYEWVSGDVKITQES